MCSLIRNKEINFDHIFVVMDGRNKVVFDMKWSLSHWVGDEKIQGSSISV
jgi:hypothetical protein